MSFPAVINVARDQGPYPAGVLQLDKGLFPAAQPMPIFRPEELAQGAASVGSFAQSAVAGGQQFGTPQQSLLPGQSSLAAAQPSTAFVSAQQAGLGGGLPVSTPAQAPGTTPVMGLSYPTSDKGVQFGPATQPPPQAGQGWGRWAWGIGTSVLGGVQSYGEAVGIKLDGEWSTTEVALASAAVVGTAAYGAYRIFWANAAPEFKKFGVGCPEGSMKYKPCKGGAKECLPGCYSIPQITGCKGGKIWGSAKGYLYCNPTALRRGDVDYSAQINALLAEITKASAEATSQQVAKAAAEAAAIQKAEVDAKAKTAGAGIAQVQQIVQQAQAAGQKFVEKAQELGDKTAALQQQQAQTSDPQKKAALQGQIANNEAQLKNAEAEFVATENKAAAAIEQVQTTAAQQNAATEARTEAAAAKLSTAVPVLVNRRGATKIAHRGAITTIRKVVAQRAVTRRVSPPKPVPKRRRVKVVGGQYAYYVPAVRAKRCKKGFTVGKSRKGKRTCRAVTNK